jgi:hypothetical protein
MATAKPMRRAARPLALSLALWCGLSAGCVELNAFVTPDAKPAPTGLPRQIVATWENRVMWTPDTMHNGQQVPGVAGRLYLFGEEVGGVPMLCDGAVVVDLYDDRPITQGGQPVLLEEWRIDEKSLHRLKRKDMIGWGYTLFLPWSTLEKHPDINLIHLAVRYTPTEGNPLFFTGSPMTISLGEVPPGVAWAKATATQAVQQAAAQQPATQPSPVRPAVYQPPAYVPPQQAVYQQPAGYLPPPVVPVQAVNVPPAPAPQPVAVPPPGPVPDAVSPPVQRQPEPPPPPLRVRIGVPQRDQD